METFQTMTIDNVRRQIIIASAIWSLDLYAEGNGKEKHHLQAELLIALQIKLKLLLIQLK